MRVAAFQFDVRRGEVERNLATVEAALRQARERGIELVVLPEMWPTSFPEVGGEVEALVAQSERAEARVAELSRELDLLVAGSAFARSTRGSKPTNRLSLFER